MTFPLKESRVDGKTVIFAGRPSAQEIHSGMSPACLVGVAGTGELHHIRRHGFPAANAVVPVPANMPRHMSMAMNRDRAFSMLSSCYLLEMQAKAPFPMCCGLCWLLSKKRGPPGFLAARCLPVEKRLELSIYPGSPNIPFFRLFRLFGRGEVWRGGTGTSCRFPANGRTSLVSGLSL